MNKLFLLAGVMLWQGLQAYILDGTVTPTVIRHKYTFVNGDQVTGDVSFEQGFTVPAGAFISFNSRGTVNGPIELNETGIIFYLGQLNLGPRATGFPQGGILAGNPNGNFTTPNLFHDINLSSDISIGGPLQFLNTASPAFNLAGNTLTLVNDGSSRGSIMCKYVADTGFDGYFTSNLIFKGGTIVGLDDFVTGYGPRIRISGLDSDRAGVSMENMTVVLRPDSIMTVTGYSLTVSGGGGCMFRTPATATVDVTTETFAIQSDTSLFLETGITLSSALITWLDTNGSIINLNNATIKTDVLNQIGGGGALHVHGLSRAIRQGSDGQWVFANSESLDIAGGSKLVCENGVRLRT
jgi:hypothetical protein